MDFAGSIRVLWSNLTDLFFPRCCEACDRELLGTERVICTACRITLPRLASTIQSEPEELHSHIPEIQDVVSFLLFTKKGKVQRLLHALKYRNCPDVGMELGFLFGQELNVTFAPEHTLIVPVPLHKRKKKKRGYNQSDKIAEGFALATGLNWSPVALQRTKNTISQTGKTKQERMENVKDVFVLNETVTGKTVILMDDVYTTGATTQACAKVLIAGGCDAVYIYTLARAQH